VGLKNGKPCRRPPGLGKLSKYLTQIHGLNIGISVSISANVARKITHPVIASLDHPLYRKR